jgi:hypothetical protein
MDGRAGHGEGDLTGVPADQDGYGVADSAPQHPALGERVDDAGGLGVGHDEVGGAARRHGGPAGHGDHVARALQGAYDADLLLR